MRVPIVRHGNETTTGGKMIALTATICDGGCKIALHGDQATCANCKGLWKIIGTGEGVRENGRAAVIDGDHVLCPCKKNRVLAGADARMFVDVNKGARNARAVEALQATQKQTMQQHDEKFTLHDASGSVLSNTYYTVQMPSGELRHGVTDLQGNTARYSTKGAETIRIYLGHKRES